MEGQDRNRSINRESLMKILYQKMVWCGPIDALETGVTMWVFSSMEWFNVQLERLHDLTHENN